MSKLQLLDAGLLLEAKELETFLNRRDSLELTDERLDVDTLVSRLKAHVQAALSGAGLPPREAVKRKNGAVAEYRATVIGEFLKGSGSASNVCQHCRGYVPSLYRHAGTKIFINPLRRNQQVMMDAKGMDTDRVFSGSHTGRRDGGEEGTTTTKTATSPDEVSDPAALKGMKFLTPMHVYEHLRQLWRNEAPILNLLFGSQLLSSGGHHHQRPGGSASNNLVDHRIFFTEAIAVPPCRFRPPSVFGGDRFDHPQNAYLLEIIKLNAQIVELRTDMRVQADASSAQGKKELDRLEREKGSLFGDLIRTWVALQEQVNYLFDSSKNTRAPGNVPPPGIKQILEKKEGLFRKHMMGKRVNYAARSVISPDPNLETSEIGVPLVFATRLTYPEPVTEHNVAALRQAVINGPETHPGAAYVQMEDGSLANLEAMTAPARLALANQLRTPSTGITSGQPASKKVLRHVRTGDVVLMNRQPTLHKPSIMAHRVRVLPGEKTIRMHYANCNTYNADFDGDEMNMHLPQNELARAEAYTIANTDNQYLVPTDGSPLRGLIQDHVVTGVLLCLKDTWLTREVYQQLLWGSLPENGGRPLVTLPPAILRPQPLWSGKQVITTVLANLTAGRPALSLSSPCKIGAKLWGRGHGEEATVILQANYLCTGLMDKSQLGASAYGITHAVYELYGPAAAGALLTCLGRLLTKYDQQIGFTCRMDDLLLRPAANARRRALIDGSHVLGRQVLAEYAKLSESPDDGDDGRRRRPSIARAQEAAALERILHSDELARGLDGAMKVRMNGLTSSIIEACLPEGQLRPFPLNNMSLMTNSGAKGSMVNFSQIAGLLGQQELEGRRVPVMVSGKSLPSFPPFDPRPRAGGYITQRFLTGIRPQEFFFHCMAGREGLIDTAVKTSRSGYLQRCLIKHLEGLRTHYDGSVRDCDGSILQFHYGEDGLDVLKQRYLASFPFAAANLPLLSSLCQPAAVLGRVNTSAAVRAARKAAKKPAKYEPVLARYPPTVYLGSVSERFHRELEQYLATDSAAAAAAPDEFRALMWIRYMRALVEPGEAVGLLAAQSVGEPSTQMTLNTFHFAGFGAKNVTLGIPRLREIIMTASAHIKTPSITVPLLTDSTLSPEELAKRLARLTLKQIVRDIVVEERLVLNGHDDEGGARGLATGTNGSRRSRIYRVTLSLLPLRACQEQFAVGEGEIREALENAFVRVLLAAIERVLKRSGRPAGGRGGGATKIGDDSGSVGGLISQTTLRAGVGGLGRPGSGDGDEERSLGTTKSRARGDDDDDDDDDDDEHGRDEEDSSERGAKEIIRQAQQRQNNEDDEDGDVDDDNDEDGQARRYKDTLGDDDDDEVDAALGMGLETRTGTEDEMARTAEAEVEEEELLPPANRRRPPPLPSSATSGPLRGGSGASIRRAKKESLLAQARHIFRNYVYDPLGGPTGHQVTLDMVYPASQTKLLLLDILERCIGDVVVRQVPGISRAFPHRDDPNAGPGITTEGANLRGLWEHVLAQEHLDFKRLYTNDVHAMLVRYGVEAARATIVKEVAAVFAVYGISVDHRHLYLIADYMTQEGGYRPFNRMGMASSPSPLLQMTFETTVGFLRTAALSGDWDDLLSPSSRLVMGLPVALGTGSFEVRHSLVPE